LIVMNTRQSLDRVAMHARGVIAAALMLLAIPGILAAGLHHHRAGESHSTCAICVAAHAPAEATPHVVPSAPSPPRAEPIVEALAHRQCAPPRTTTAPRGPPAA
jgi:hypothetical protein